jgi:O-methyltransferase involved in polyketide biosynthesis
MDSPASARISPTAHYTGFVWYRNGMSHPAFKTREGQLLHAALRPMNAVYEFAGRASLEGMLLARHRVIDFLLEQAIASGEVGQVVEVAAGLSPRGRRFSARHAERGLVYIEADLPGMIARKREVLGRAGLGSEHHHLVEVDALADDGPRSLFEACGALLDPSLGCALITEGLLGYFDPISVEGMWHRFARFLGGYPSGLYLADLHTRADAEGLRGAKLFQRLLSMFARGQVHLHFDGPEDAEEALRAAGFGDATVHDPADFSAEVELPNTRRFVVHVLAARPG